MAHLCSCVNGDKLLCLKLWTLTTDNMSWSVA